MNVTSKFSRKVEYEATSNLQPSFRVSYNNGGVIKGIHNY